jgi:hypothetical protein
MIRTLLPYILFSLIQISLAQKFSFEWPIDAPRVLSGNYGELRPNHFHAGIDFTTNRQVNRNIYAVDDGYVSRIRVSPVGYGKSVYITHPNGLVSVYGHLNAFGLKIGEVVKREQLARHSFEVEILQRPGLMPVKRNELIALSGNTGGSTGPHLHFELRDAVSETPLNPLFYYPNSDSIHPEVHHLAIYSLADTLLPAMLKMFSRGKGQGPAITLPDVELKNAVLGIAFSGYDKSAALGSRNNVHAAWLYLDNRLIYSHALRSIDFADNRFVNEFSETINRVDFQKCFMPTLYPPRLYGDNLNKGRIILKDTLFHHVRLRVTDEAGNTQVISFRLRTLELNSFTTPQLNGDAFVNCNRNFLFRGKGLTLNIPAHTLYRSGSVFLHNQLESNGRLEIVALGANLASAATIGFKVPQVYTPDRRKLVLKSSSATYPVNIRNDSAFFEVKNFGIFQLVVDAAPPLIKLLHVKRKKKMPIPNGFSVFISDRLSGIKKYSMFLNHNWVIAEYDAKNDLLTYFFDEDTPAGVLNFSVEAEDRAGNISTFKYALKRK